MPFDTIPGTPLAQAIDKLHRQSIAFLYEVNASLAWASGSPELAAQIRAEKPTDSPTCACVDALCGHNAWYGKHSQEPVETPGMLCGYCQEEAERD